MRKTPLAMVALALLGLLVIAGCGGGSSGSTSSGGGGSETANASESESGGYGYKSGGAGAAESEPASETTEGGAAAGGGEAAVVKVANTPKLGKAIVDAEGMTLYDFHKDKGTTSACYGSCAEVWPPLLTEGKPTASGGAEAALLGVTKRKDGTEQVTYKGHPLYTYVADHKPGETTGNDVDSFGAQWYALEPNGEEH